MSGQLFRFLLVGTTTTSLNYVLFVGLTRLGLHHLASATVGWFAGLLVSFVLNKRFTFGLRSRLSAREATSFFGGYVAQLLLGLAGYVVLIDGLGLSPTPAFLVNLVVVASFSFAFMRLAVFRPTPAGG